LLEDGWRVVLDGRNTSHLDRSLDSADEDKATERASALKELDVGLGFLLVLVGDHVLDLIEFSAHEWIVHVAVGVQLGEGPETFFRFAVVDKPSAECKLPFAHRLSGSAYLGDSGKSKMRAAKKPAGTN